MEYPTYVVQDEQISEETSQQRDHDDDGDKDNSDNKNQSKWGPNEDAKLFMLTKCLDEKSFNWEIIAHGIGPGFTSTECWSRWHSLQSKGKLKYWNSHEDAMLIEAVKKQEGTGRPIDWTLVSSFFVSSRTAQQCKLRWCGILRPRMDKVALMQKWNDEMDSKLYEAIENFCNNVPDITVKIWERIAQKLGNGFTVEMCRARWDELNFVNQTHANGRPWSDEEDEALISTVKKFKATSYGSRINWIEVAKILGPGRTPQQYNMRWNAILKPRVGGIQRSGPWTADEDKLLAEAVEKAENQRPNLESGKQRVNWVKVSEYLGGVRSPQQCNQRWHASLKPKISGEMKLGPWSPQEDALLLEAIELFDGHGMAGSVDWIKVSTYMRNTRSSHQCNHRWHDFIRPRIMATSRSGAWTEEEDVLLTSIVLKLESVLKPNESVRWTVVAEAMGNHRSFLQCKHRWTSLKTRLQNGESLDYDHSIARDSGHLLQRGIVATAPVTASKSKKHTVFSPVSSASNSNSRVKVSVKKENKPAARKSPVITKEIVTAFLANCNENFSKKPANKTRVDGFVDVDKKVTGQKGPIRSQGESEQRKKIVKTESQGMTSNEAMSILQRDSVANQVEFATMMYGNAPYPYGVPIDVLLLWWLFQLPLWLSWMLSQLCKNAFL